jgi:hypothetical protein
MAEFKHTPETKIKRRHRLEQVYEWLVSGEYTRSTIVKLTVEKFRVAAGTAWNDIKHVREKLIPSKHPPEQRETSLATQIAQTEAHLARCIEAKDNHAAMRCLIWLGELRGLRQQAPQVGVRVNAEAAVVTAGNVTAEDIDRYRALFGLPPKVELAKLPAKGNGEPVH